MRLSFGSIEEHTGFRYVVYQDQLVLKVSNQSYFTKQEAHIDGGMEVQKLARMYKRKGIEVSRNRKPLDQWQKPH